MRRNRGPWLSELRVNSNLPAMRGASLEVRTSALVQFPNFHCMEQRKVSHSEPYSNLLICEQK